MNSLHSTAREFEPKFVCKEDVKSESAGPEPILTTPNWPDAAD